MKVVDKDNLKQLINLLESFIKNPSKGLPEDVFLFISRMTPLINVDLLIKNEENETLLTWRDDGFFPAGWHIPGGIVRYKEKIRDRIKAVAKNELGASVKIEGRPLTINEVIIPQETRGHFISLLYRCILLTPPDEKLRYRGGRPQAGQWAWHKKCPYNLISVHNMYREFI